MMVSGWTRTSNGGANMKIKLSDLPRHKMPLWEVLAFVAVILGFIGLAASGKAAQKAAVAKSAAPASAAAGFLDP